MVSGTIDIALAASAREMERVLDHLLPRPEGPEAQVIEAMRYAALGGGKRFRPFLARQSARLFDVNEESALRVGAALECVHTYSLVHDDLPCMDDDDMRHGKPATHVRFGEATAVLAGDALLTLAFEILAHPDTHPDHRVRSDLVLRLAMAAGAGGMVGGQMIDIAGLSAAADIGAITRLQRMKTGALIVFACEAGGLLGHGSRDALHALHAYAHDLGLAYQIADDLLDAEGKAEIVGKATGKDAEAGKATFISILGIDRARDQANMLADQAVAHLDMFDDRADLLRQAARFVVSRAH